MRGTRSTFLALLAVLLSPLAANADFIQLGSESELSGPITTLDFEDGSTSGPGVAFEVGSFIVSTGFSTMQSGVQGLAEADPFTEGPDNLAFFSSGVFQVGLYFGNDDLCCTQGFTATLYAYDFLDNLIGSVSLIANMNDTADQFLGIQTDTLIFRTMLDYGDANTLLWGVIDDFSYGGNSLSAVPEPGTLALLGIGLLGMGAARRSKKA